jgi:hypothetical protein
MTVWVTWLAALSVECRSFDGRWTYSPAGRNSKESMSCLKTPPGSASRGSLVTHSSD